MAATHDLMVAPHPLLMAAAFVARWPAPLCDVASPTWLRAALAARPEIDEPAVRAAIARLGGSDEIVRDAVRKLLRHGGYKPSGRGKPASEYLLGAAASEAGLSSINPAVDLCNAVSLHGGLPISVVDLALVEPPLRLAIATPGTSYVFNASGQTIDVSGLLCLHDAAGPCANAVKDSQRSKTRDTTVAVLCVVWGASAVAERVGRLVEVYRELTIAAGASIDDVRLVVEGAA